MNPHCRSKVLLSASGAAAGVYVAAVHVGINVLSEELGFMMRFFLLSPFSSLPCSVSTPFLLLLGSCGDLDLHCKSVFASYGASVPGQALTKRSLIAETTR